MDLNNSTRSSLTKKWLDVRCFVKLGSENNFEGNKSSWKRLGWMLLVASLQDFFRVPRCRWLKQKSNSLCLRFIHGIILGIRRLVQAPFCFSWAHLFCHSFRLSSFMLRSISVQFQRWKHLLFICRSISKIPASISAMLVDIVLKSQHILRDNLRCSPANRQLYFFYFRARRQTGAAYIIIEWATFARVLLLLAVGPPRPLAEPRYLLSPFDSLTLCLRAHGRILCEFQKKCASWYLHS